MKKRAIIVFAVLMMSATVPAIAQEESSQEQVICNLASNNCLATTLAIEKKMKKVREEMKKGKSYSAEDLQKIEKKLKEVQDMVDKLQPKPAAK